MDLNGVTDITQVSRTFPKPELPSFSVRPMMAEEPWMRTYVITTILTLFATTFFSQSADRAALVIGIDQYQNLPANAQLRVAVQDATLLSDTLSSLPEPFDVTLLTNANRESVSRGIDQFIDTAKNAKCALVYFAGHGIEFHGENYLLVSDTNISAKPDEGVRRVKDRLYYESLSLHKLMEDLNETGANLQLVILDACRDNPLEIEAPNGTRSIMGSQGGLGRVNAPSGMLISYSADAGQQANDGLFTSILAAQLKTPGSTLMEVFAQTRLEVRKQATVLQAEGKGVLHEPAEYSKLEPSALRFSFVKGDGNPRPAPSLALLRWCRGNLQNSSPRKSSKPKSSLRSSIHKWTSIGRDTRTRPMSSIR